MMKSSDIRASFLDFFKSRGHGIYPSAPMVIKNDPSLMFTNAGMNQFKDVFLGNHEPPRKRVANSQKCLRVSGKHNDLEEVGIDTYHHTMFEMLGNWSFGDYFKKEAIAWAWELLTGVYRIDKDRLYVTVFEGSAEDGLQEDKESYDLWKAFVPENRILYGSKKDNFWEMGDTGPCGPCSEIHVDLRNESERKQTDGAGLVNREHPLVIEIWNLVFIEFNRKSDGKLISLPEKHVDTGMGFERLCMVLQHKQSNYDTDVFRPYIEELSGLCGIPYGHAKETDIAMRVVADHLRAVSFAIADGELPSNNKAGYVIRRILRRAVRYGYTFLGLNEAFVCRLVPTLVKHMGEAFPELKAQEALIARVIAEEEQTFLRTLAVGIQKFEQYISAHPGLTVVDGAFAFELFDTYGFPPDLTALMAREKGLSVDMKGFEEGMAAQKSRSRDAAVITAGDWITLRPWREETRFLGYERLEAEVEIIRYRNVSHKGEPQYHVVLDQTPFYAESGGQVGDRGYLEINGERFPVVDTRKENNLSIHIMPRLPEGLSGKVVARVDGTKRHLTANNHTATHLMHSALKTVLGKHVQQKGSLVDDQRLRFDFSHFAKMTAGEIRQVEQLVNEKIRENLPMEEHRELSMEEAVEMGATALFGEKYGEKVRVIAFDKEFSAELCGGTHVQATGQIGLFVIVSESAIAAGIRRIEALTGKAAEEHIQQKLDELETLKELLKHPKNSIKALQQLLQQHDSIKKELTELQQAQRRQLAGDLLAKAEQLGDIHYIGVRLNINAGEARDLAFQMKGRLDRLFLVIAHESEGKPGITVMVDETLIKEQGLHAGKLVGLLAKHIQGGGGGQPFFATAGGKDPKGLDKVLSESRSIIQQAASQ
ncbi:MAG: alanine--tRNA ligase [Bacteroidales bacterium]|nr:alanine--tRNA ligase [Bacteroidales bacterium]